MSDSGSDMELGFDDADIVCKITSNDKRLQQDLGATRYALDITKCGTAGLQDFPLHMHRHSRGGAGTLHSWTVLACFVFGPRIGQLLSIVMTSLKTHHGMAHTPQHKWSTLRQDQLDQQVFLQVQVELVIGRCCTACRCLSCYQPLTASQ